jgi:hypothetical protein
MAVCTIADLRHPGFSELSNGRGGTNVESVRLDSKMPAVAEHTAGGNLSEGIVSTEPARESGRTKRLCR